MSANQNPAAVSSETAYVITRVFDAPRDLVWKVWTEEKHFAQWCAPHGYTTQVAKFDFRSGGIIHVSMRSPEGNDMWGKWLCKEVTPPSRLVLLDMFSDEEGNTVPASHYGLSAEYPLESIMTITFEESEGKTTLTFVHEISETLPEREGMEDGWMEIFERLGEYLARM